MAVADHRLPRLDAALLKHRLAALLESFGHRLLVGKGKAERRAPYRLASVKGYRVRRLPLRIDLEHDPPVGRRDDALRRMRGEPRRGKRGRKNQTFSDLHLRVPF